MEPPWTPQKQPCKKWLFQSIGWWTKPIFAYRKYANEEIHQTSRNPSIGKKTNGLGFRCSLQGRASRYGLTEIRSAVGSARPRWCHGDGTSQTPERRRGNNLDLEMGCWIDLQQNQLRKKICCSTKRLFRFLDVFTYQTLDVSITSNWRTWHLIVSFLIGFFSS